MFKKIFCILILFTMLLSFVLYKKQNEKLLSHKVLRVVSADLFYIDINDNAKADENELFKLQDVHAFDTVLNDYTKAEAKKLMMNEFDYLKAGYLAYNFALDEISGSDVIISAISKSDKKYNYAKIIFKGEDLGEFYLKNGLGYLKENPLNSAYFSYFSPNQIKSNIDELSKLDFVILNLKSKVFHNLNCEWANLIKRASLILRKDAREYIPCKACINTLYGDMNKINIPKTIQKINKGTCKTFDDIEFCTINPHEFSKPDKMCKTEACKKLVYEIDNSKKSIDIALYGIGNIEKINTALRNAKNRGVKIRAVADYSKNTENIYPHTLDFIKQYSAKTDKTEVIMHNKFFIFDKSKVMTGSANITSSGLSYNANLIVFINSNDVADIYEKEFNQMYEGKFSIHKEKIEKTKVHLKNSEIEIYFLPKSNAYNDLILKEIKNAKSEIFLSAFYLTDKEIIMELINAKRRGVNVLVLMDAVGMINFKTRLNNLKEAKIPVITENWGGKNHEKTIMIDGSKLILGSANFSKSAFLKNDENVILIKNPQIAKFYKNYYLSLFNSIDKKYLRFIPRAESFESKNSCYDGIDNNFDGLIDIDDKGCQNHP